VACAPGQRCYEVPVTAGERQQQEGLEQGLELQAQQKVGGTNLQQNEQEQQPAASEAAAGLPKGPAEDKPELSALERLWRLDQQQQTGARQQQVALRVGTGAGGSRRQLASSQQQSSIDSSSSGSSTSSTGSWEVAAKCWAFELARRISGERAALNFAERWLL